MCDERKIQCMQISRESGRRVGPCMGGRRAALAASGPSVSGWRCECTRSGCLQMAQSVWLRDAPPLDGFGNACKIFRPRPGWPACKHLGSRWSTKAQMAYLLSGQESHCVHAIHFDYKTDGLSTPRSSSGAGRTAVLNGACTGNKCASVCAISTMSARLSMQRDCHVAPPAGSRPR